METTDFDIAVFETISALLRDQSSSAANRRDGERRPFPYTQLLAPFDGTNLPGAEQLRVVRCHDLSPRGFSFRSDQEPDFQQVVIGLGRVPFQFFVAEIVHVRPIVTGSGREYHVGCRFLRRVAGEN